MKRLIFQVLILLTISCTYSCNKDLVTPPQGKLKLKGTTAYFIPFKFGLPSESSKTILETKEYDLDGNLIKYEYDDIDHFIEDYVYLNGLLKEKTVSNIIDILSRHVYSYQDGKLSSEFVYDEDGLHEKYIYDYYVNEDVPFKMSYWWEYFDNSPTTHHYSYDSNHNLTKDSISYSSTIPYGILFWEYDSHNNKTKESYYSSENKMTTVQYTSYYTYQSDGKIKEFIFPPNWHKFTKYIYIYDIERISQIDVFESDNGIDGDFEQTGIIEYEYSYY